jgi:lysophospholipase L1-like esterase
MNTRTASLRRSLGTVYFVLACAALACSSPPASEDDDGGTSGTSGTGGSGAPTGGTSSGGSGGSGVSGSGTSGSSTGGGVTGGTGALGGAGQAGTGAGGTSAGAGGAGNGGTTSGGAGSGAGGVTPGGTGGGGGNSAGRAGSAGGGAAGAGGGSAGTGGASGFNPCPATGACEILPLGDSITDGVGVSGGGGYRIELFRLALMAQQEITFVGGSMNGPQMVDNQPFPRSHEGHSGWTITQIDGIVPSPALDPDPHIILLHIGTNDMRGDVSMSGTRLGTLIDQIVMDLPNALLVVATIIPYPSQASQVTTYNNAIPAIVEARANAGKHVVLVDQFTGFPNSELADGVHPNAQGYARMARVWYAAISSYLR